MGDSIVCGFYYECDLLPQCISVKYQDNLLCSIYILLEVTNLRRNDSRLTSSEITSLWVQYIRETMAICISKYVLATVKDSQIRSLFEFCLGLSEKHLKVLTKILNNENSPLPNGFTGKDVNLQAPSLFTDSFWLQYIHDMTIHGLSGHGMSFSGSVRKDIRDHYYQCNIDAMDVYNKSIDILLSKGIYERDPIILRHKIVNSLRT